jgi:hypothetical protein
MGSAPGSFSEAAHAGIIVTVAAKVAAIKPASRTERQGFIGFPPKQSQGECGASGRRLTLS